MRGNDAARTPMPGPDVSQHRARGRASDMAATSPEGERTLSVAGVLVHAQEEAVSAVAATIRNIPGAIVHACAAGKLAITLEAADPASIVEHLTAIQRTPGVLSAALISEHSAPLDTIDEDLTHE